MIIKGDEDLKNSIEFMLQEISRVKNFIIENSAMIKNQKELKMYVESVYNDVKPKDSVDEKVLKVINFYGYLVSLANHVSREVSKPESMVLDEPKKSKIEESILKSAQGQKLRVDISDELDELSLKLTEFVENYKYYKGIKAEAERDEKKLNALNEYIKLVDDQMAKIEEIINSL